MRFLGKFSFLAAGAQRKPKFFGLCGRRLGKDATGRSRFPKTSVLFWEMLLGLEGAFGQLEDGRLFEDVGSGGLAQKFQSTRLTERGVSEQGTGRFDR